MKREMRRLQPVFRLASASLLATLGVLALGSCTPRPRVVTPADRSAIDPSGDTAVQIDFGGTLPAGALVTIQLLAGVDSPPASITDLTERFTIGASGANGSLAAADLAVGRNTLFVALDQDGNGVAESSASSSFSWEPDFDPAAAALCDLLDPGRCLFPFPNDYFTVEDPSMASGRRVSFARDAMPANVGGVHIDPTEWNRNDGFSPGAKILTLVEDLDLAQTGAAPITEMERSLDADAPIVLLDAESGERQLSWSERDSLASDPASSALTIRPGKNLKDGRRYIVALRRLRDASGAMLPARRLFRVYRDRVPTYLPGIEARREHMEQIFSDLARAGIAREDLFLAWDFTVASTRNLSERLLHMRDDAFASLQGGAPSFTVTSVEDNLDSRIYRRVTGTFQVPLYLTNNGQPPARLTQGPDGLPTAVGTFTAPFICNIPRATTADGNDPVVPARAGIYGHGLLGSNSEVNAGNVKDMSNEHNFVFCATKWAGMSNDDVNNVFFLIPEMSRFPTLTDRLHQGILNFLFLGRLMVHPSGFTSHAAFRAGASNTPVFDTSDLFYDGNSQGAINGGAATAVAQDWTRAVLGVPGMNYSTLLRRSVDFDSFFTFVQVAYPEELDIPLLIALLQMLWDRVETNGHANHLTQDPYPNTPAHKILLHVAFGDHQVANVTAEVEARTLGARIHQPALAAGRHSDVTPYFGIEPLPAEPYDGSAIIIWDSGTPTPPTQNVPPRPPTYGQDPHETPRRQPAARLQKSEFLRSDGAVVNVCADAPCPAVDP